MMKSESAKITCPVCGAEQLGAHRVCTMCGAVLRSEGSVSAFGPEAAVAREASPAKRHMRKPALIATLGAVALVCLFGVFAVYAWMEDVALREAAAAAAQQSPQAVVDVRKGEAGPAYGGILCAVDGKCFIATAKGIAKAETGADLGGTLPVIVQDDACWLTSDGQRLFYLSDANYVRPGNPIGYEICSCATDRPAKPEVLYQVPAGSVLSSLNYFDDSLYFLEGTDISAKVCRINLQDNTAEMLLELPADEAWLMVDGNQLSLFWRLGVNAGGLCPLDPLAGPDQLVPNLSGMGAVSCVGTADSLYYYAVFKGLSNSCLKMQSPGGSFADYPDTGPVSAIAAADDIVAYALADGSIGWLSPSTGIAHDMREPLKAAGIELGSSPQGVGIYGSSIIFRTADGATYQIDVNTEQASCLQEP